MVYRWSTIFTLSPICYSQTCLFFSLENREDLLNPSNNRLTEVLEEANNLFKDGTYELQLQSVISTI